LRDLSTLEILLYLFLVAVSDRNGLSFYHDDRIASLLKIDLPALGKAREGLIRRSLIAYQSPLYQVLSLPPKPIPLPSKEEMEKQEQDAALPFQKRSGRYCNEDRYLGFYPSPLLC
jgi:hypothetical protein